MGVAATRPADGAPLAADQPADEGDLLLELGVGEDPGAMEVGQLAQQLRFVDPVPAEDGEAGGGGRDGVGRSGAVVDDDRVDSWGGPRGGRATVAGVLMDQRSGLVGLLGLDASGDDAGAVAGL